MGYISAADLARLAHAMDASAYGQYLLHVIEHGDHGGQSEHGS
jgi:hypothetical protein